MAYCTLEDLTLAYTEAVIADLAVDTAGEDLEDTGPAAVVERAIEDAQAEVDAALATHYETPLDDEDVPEMVRRMTASLAFNRLVLRRRRTLDDDDQLRYDAVTKDLDAIRRGEKAVPGLTMTLGLAAATAMRTPSTAEALQIANEETLIRGF